MISVDPSVKLAVKNSEVPFVHSRSDYGSSYENANTSRTTSVSTSPEVCLEKYEKSEKYKKSEKSEKAEKYEKSEKHFNTENFENSEVDSGGADSLGNYRSRTHSQECSHELVDVINTREIGACGIDVECQPKFTLIDLWRVYGVDSHINSKKNIPILIPMWFCVFNMFSVHKTGRNKH